METRLRPMEEKDLDQVLAIEKVAFTTPWSRASFAFEISSNPMSKYFVIEEGSRILAYGGIWSVLGESHVTTIAVDLDFRGRSLGKRIFQALEDQAIKNASQSLSLEVRASNTVAKNLYKSFGLRELGIRPGYYQDNNEDAIIMLKEFKDVL